MMDLIQTENLVEKGQPVRSSGEITETFPEPATEFDIRRSVRDKVL